MAKSKEPILKDSSTCQPQIGVLSLRNHIHCHFPDNYN